MYARRYIEVKVRSFANDHIVLDENAKLSKSFLIHQYKQIQSEAIEQLFFGSSVNGRQISEYMESFLVDIIYSANILIYETQKMEDVVDSWCRKIKKGTINYDGGIVDSEEIALKRHLLNRYDKKRHLLEFYEVKESSRYIQGKYSNKNPDTRIKSDRFFLFSILRLFRYNIPSIVPPDQLFQIFHTHSFYMKKKHPFTRDSYYLLGNSASQGITSAEMDNDGDDEVYRVETVEKVTGCLGIGPYQLGNFKQRKNRNNNRRRRRRKHKPPQFFVNLKYSNIGSLHFLHLKKVFYITVPKRILKNTIESYCIMNYTGRTWKKMKIPIEINRVCSEYVQNNYTSQKEERICYEVRREVDLLDQNDTICFLSFRLENSSFVMIPYFQMNMNTLRSLFETSADISKTSVGFRR